MRDVLSRVTRLAVASFAIIGLAMAWAGIASAATPGAGSVGPAPAPAFQVWQGEVFLAGNPVLAMDPSLCPSATGGVGSDAGNTICDHYRLTVTGAGPVNVRIDWASTDDDWDLYVYRCTSPADPTVPCDILVAASADSGTNFESVNIGNGAATYEVRVLPIFLLMPSNYSGCAAFTARATCSSTGGTVITTIDPPLSISDARVIEGDSGTAQATFAVALGWTTVAPVTVNYVTKDRSAGAGSDYVPQTGTIVIPAGETSATVSIPVIGDVANEQDEVFEVDLVLPDPPIVVAKIEDGQGFATIVDDDYRRIVSGSGNVGLIGQGTFSLRVAENRMGKLKYRDASSRFYSTGISAAAFTDVSHSATIDGSGYNNGLRVTYTLEVADNGAGALDTYVLTLSDGTRVTGPLASGNISYTG